MPKIKFNNLLSICIPTYNRPNFINLQLKKILPIVQLHNVRIFISDNSENTETQELIELFNSDLIIYNRNTHNIQDQNFLKVIQLPKLGYRWLFSDSDYFNEDLLKTVLEICEQNIFDYIFLNSGRVTDIHENKPYSDANQLLSELGWHLTHISSIIYSSKVFYNISSIDRYLNTNFIHHALIFESFENTQMNAIYLNRPLYYNNGLKKNNTWSNLVFEIWAKRWPEYIMSLPPSYTLSSKLSCIKKHNKNTKLFGVKHLLSYYARNLIDKKIFRLYSKHFTFSLSKREKIFLILILNIPQNILRKFYTHIYHTKS